MKKQNKILIFGAIVLIGIIWAITGNQEKVTEDRLPSYFRSSFMEGCLGEGGIELYDYCDCAFHYLDDNYSNKIIMRESTKMLKDEYYEPEIMIEAAEACLFEISY